jgi:predicted nucleic acid-binding protein
LTAVLDTSVVIAFMNRREDDHEWVVTWMETIGGGRVHAAARRRVMAGCSVQTMVRL